MKRSIWLLLFMSAFVFTKAQTITMDTFSGNFCSGESFYVYVSTTGTFDPTTYLIVEISDNFGNYYGVYISPLTGITADSILCTLYPQYDFVGGGYRIRVLSMGATGGITSNDNGSDLTVFAPPAPTLTVSGNGCAGIDSLTTTGGGGSPITWYQNGAAVDTSLDSSYTPEKPGSYTATYTSPAQGYCVSPASNPVTINGTVAGVTISVNAETCYGTANTYTANPVNGGTAPTYQWYQDNIATGTDTSSYSTSTANSTDSIKVVMTSNAVCANGVQATATVVASTYPVPAAPVLSATGHGCLGVDTLVLQNTTSPFGVIWYQNSVVIDSSISAYTVAGGNGAGSAANQLRFPYGVFVDAAGNIYVADDFNDRVQKFPPGSTSMTNGVTVAAFGLGAPTDICVDDSGNLYVADPGNGVVWKFPAGSDSATVGAIVAGDPNPGANESAANGLDAPVAIYLDSSHNLYVADDGNDRVQKFPPGSDSLTNAVTVAKNQINSVGGLYLDQSGNVYVSDYDSGFVWKFPAGGNASTVGTIVAAHQLVDPGGLYVDGNNNVYVADAENNRIQKFLVGSDSSTVGITVAGGLIAGSSPTQLSFPVDVFLDTSGDIYVVDNGNNRIQKFIPGAPDTLYIPVTAASYTASYISSVGICPSVLSDTVVIYTPPVVSLSWDSMTSENLLLVGQGIGSNSSLDTNWCYTDMPIIPLLGGVPPGGIYSGNYVVNDTLNSFSGNYNHSIDTIFYTYTDANGCSAIAVDSFGFVICEGINNVTDQNNISLFPDPNTGSFMLETSDDALGKEFIVSDMLGRIIAREVITTNKQIVTLENIAPGIYALKIEDGNNAAIRFTVTR